MGYQTTFTGTIYLDRPLDSWLYDFLMKLSQTRRMKRDVTILRQMGFQEDYGVEGEFFVDGSGLYGQLVDSSVIDSFEPPITQPSPWCGWQPTTDGLGIEWNESEKFYEADQWMIYLIDRILAPEGYVANGIIFAQGESSDDTWELHVLDNDVSVYHTQSFL